MGETPPTRVVTLESAEPWFEEVLETFEHVRQFVDAHLSAPQARCTPPRATTKAGQWRAHANCAPAVPVTAKRGRSLERNASLSSAPSSPLSPVSRSASPRQRSNAQTPRSLTFRIVETGPRPTPAFDSPALPAPAQTPAGPDNRARPPLPPLPAPGPSVQTRAFIQIEEQRFAELSEYIVDAFQGAETRFQEQQQQIAQLLEAQALQSARVEELARSNASLSTRLELKERELLDLAAAHAAHEKTHQKAPEELALVRRGCVKLGRALKQLETRVGENAAGAPDLSAFATCAAVEALQRSVAQLAEKLSAHKKQYRQVCGALKTRLQDAQRELEALKLLPSPAPVPAPPPPQPVQASLPSLEVLLPPRLQQLPQQFEALQTRCDELQGAVERALKEQHTRQTASEGERQQWRGSVHERLVALEQQQRNTQEHQQQQQQQQQPQLLKEQEQRLKAVETEMREVRRICNETVEHVNGLELETVAPLPPARPPLPPPSFKGMLSAQADAEALARLSRGQSEHKTALTQLKVLLDAVQTEIAQLRKQLNAQGETCTALSERTQQTQQAQHVQQQQLKRTAQQVEAHVARLTQLAERQELYETERRGAAASLASMRDNLDAALLQVERQKTVQSTMQLVDQSVARFEGVVEQSRGVLIGRCEALQEALDALERTLKARLEAAETRAETCTRAEHEARAQIQSLRQETAELREEVQQLRGLHTPSAPTSDAAAQTETEQRPQPDEGDREYKEALAAYLEKEDADSPSSPLFPADGDSPSASRASKSGSASSSGFNFDVSSDSENGELRRKQPGPVSVQTGSAAAPAAVSGVKAAATPGASVEPLTLRPAPAASGGRASVIENDFCGRGVYHISEKRGSGSKSRSRSSALSFSLSASEGAQASGGAGAGGSGEDSDSDSGSLFDDLLPERKTAKARGSGR